MLFCVQAVGPKEPHFTAKAANRSDFYCRRFLRYENHARNSQFTHCAGDGRTVIATRRRNTTFGALLVSQCHQAVQGAAHFERSRSLQVLEFEKNVRTERVAERL